MHRTRYLKSVRKADGETRVLKPSTNRKLGKRIQRGQWKGMPIYTVTLEERRTCPRSCAHWEDCYGNNMPFAHRFEHGPQLEERLEEELRELQQRHATGFAVRLHVLGDFYSIPYVALWAEWLREFPALHIWGYTARHPGTDPIGDAIESVRTDPGIGPRFRIRYSGGGRANLPLSADPAEWNTPGFTCPEQTGKLASCGACGLCWESPRNVRFIAH